MMDLKITFGHISFSTMDTHFVVKSTKRKKTVLISQSHLVDQLFKLLFTDENIIKEHTFGKSKFEKMKPTDYVCPIKKNKITFK